MRNVRIHVRIEAVFVWSLYIPRRLWFVSDQRNLHYGLDALEAIFPWDNQANRRAVLRRECLAVHPCCHNGQWMHCFVETQPFDERPTENAKLLVWHSVRIQKRLKSDVFGLQSWLNFFEQLMQRKTNPGNYHRPSFNAAQTIDAFLLRNLQ